MNSHEIHAPSLGSGASVGGGGVGSYVSRWSGSGSIRRPVEAQCEIRKSHPPGETSVLETLLETTPKPDEPRGAAPLTKQWCYIWPSSYRSRTLRVTANRLSPGSDETFSAAVRGNDVSSGSSAKRTCTWYRCSRRSAWSRHIEMLCALPSTDATISEAHARRSVQGCHAPLPTLPLPMARRRGLAIHSKS